MFFLPSVIITFGVVIFIYLKVVRKSTQGNMCIAPFNVAALLAMVHAGARGDTAKQIKEALGLGKFSEQLMNATFGHIIKSMKVLFSCPKSTFSIVLE